MKSRCGLEDEREGFPPIDHAAADERDALRLASWLLRSGIADLRVEDLLPDAPPVERAA